MTETLTFQTRLRLNENQENILHKNALIFSKVEHSLYAEVAKGHSSLSCKNEFLRKFGITARQFNACRVSLEGKIAACKAAQENAIASLTQQIKALDRHIQTLQRKPSKRFVLHQKKRRRHGLSLRLAALEQDKKLKRVRLCFGGKQLFRAQYHLEKNGFSCHDDWEKAWQAKRASEFFVLGSKDETSGNQTCVATLQENGLMQLRLRLPKAMETDYGKHLILNEVHFSYGHHEIIQALNRSQAISYRFKRDAKSWRVFVSFELPKVAPVTVEGIGAIGIDLNANHIALAETDRYGNPIHSRTISWISYGKTTNQLRALTNDVCKDIVELAKMAKKPLVIEQLDFQKKKGGLREQKSKFSRLLSSFAYNLFAARLMAKAAKEGVIVHQVNPAYTSVIGRYNYAKRYGLSIHLAAALCIARRHQKFSEAPCSPTGIIPDGKGGHIAFVLPVRNRTKHVWHFWGQVKRKLTTALAAHFKAIRDRSISPILANVIVDPCCCR